MKATKYITAIIVMLALVFTSCRKSREVLNDRVEPADFLSSNKYEKLVIEINYVNGYAPSDESIRNLTSFLQNLLHKPSGIFVKMNAISSNNESFYTVSEIAEIERKNRKESTKGNVITAYVLFLDKEYIGSVNSSSKTLAITFGPSSIAVFENTIRKYSGGVTQPSTPVLEATVEEHEFGHLLGLTNNGSPMQTAHQDVNHGAHCDNSNCLMYYLAETSDIVGNLLGNNIPELDANCRADLRANGGK